MRGLVVGPARLPPPTPLCFAQDNQLVGASEADSNMELWCGGRRGAACTPVSERSAGSVPRWPQNCQTSTVIYRIGRPKHGGDCHARLTEHGDGPEAYDGHAHKEAAQGEYAGGS